MLYRSRGRRNNTDREELHFTSSPCSPCGSFEGAYTCLVLSTMYNVPYTTCLWCDHMYAQTPGSNSIITHAHRSIPYSLLSHEFFFPIPGSLGNCGIAGNCGTFTPANRPPCNCATASPNNTLTAPSIRLSPLLLIHPSTNASTSRSTAICFTLAHTKRHMALKKR